MMRSMLVRASILALSICALLSGASGAAAATLPAHADVRAGRCVESTAFRHLVASRYHVEFSRVVAADIDRDGDIDVIATTDRTLTVWVNDGTGHLTSQRPVGGPGLDGRAPTTTWRERSQSTDPANNGEAPTTPVLVEQAHAPPASTSNAAAPIDPAGAGRDRSRSRASRAPPRCSSL